MEALIHAGGKGTRMGRCGIEKPMMMIGNMHAIELVVNALMESKNISRVVVSVSDNTLQTESYLKSIGVETIRTSGNDFMGDLHQALKVMTSTYVLTCPSDLPMIRTEQIDQIINYHQPVLMDSLLAVIDEDTVRNLGITPSYMVESRGVNWVLSGISIVDRKKILAGEYLEETMYETNWPEMAININTPLELDLARLYYRE